MSRTELDVWCSQGRLTSDTQILRVGADQWQWATDLFPELDQTVQIRPPAATNLSVTTHPPAVGQTTTAIPAAARPAPRVATPGLRPLPSPAPHPAPVAGLRPLGPAAALPAGHPAQSAAGPQPLFGNVDPAIYGLRSGDEEALERVQRDSIEARPKPPQEPLHVLSWIVIIADYIVGGINLVTSSIILIGFVYMVYGYFVYSGALTAEVFRINTESQWILSLLMGYVGLGALIGATTLFAAQGVVRRESMAWGLHYFLAFCYFSFAILNLLVPIFWLATLWEIPYAIFLVVAMTIPAVNRQLTKE